MSWLGALLGGAATGAEAAAIPAAGAATGAGIGAGLATLGGTGAVAAPALSVAGGATLANAAAAPSLLSQIGSGVQGYQQIASAVQPFMTQGGGGGGGQPAQASYAQPLTQMPTAAPLQFQSPVVYYINAQGQLAMRGSG